MSEIPNAKPPENIEWALSGRKRLPFFSRQNGFIDDTPPLLDEWNYMADAHERKITHQEGRVYRAFDSIIDAVDALDPGDVFFYNRWGMSWYEVFFLDVSATIPVEHITTDGRRVYTQWGVSLRAWTATTVGGSIMEWHLGLDDYFLGGLTTDYVLDTDGVIVVIAGSSAMLVVNPVTGTVIDRISTGPVVGLRCYSTGGTPKVFFHGGSTTISVWTEASGIVLLHTIETANQVMATPIELADDRQWFISVNTSSGASRISHIPIGGGSETLMLSSTLTTPTQDFGTLDYDGTYKRIISTTILGSTVNTKIFDRDALIATIVNDGPWNVSSRWIFGPGLPYGGAATVIYRDDKTRLAVAEMFDTGALWGPGVETVGSVHRWFSDDADPEGGLFASGILCQPGLWKIREGVESGANRRLIAQPLGGNYG